VQQPGKNGQDRTSKWPPPSSSPPPPPPDYYFYFFLLTRLATLILHLLLLLLLLLFLLSLTFLPLSSVSVAPPLFHSLLLPTDLLLPLLVPTHRPTDPSRTFVHSELHLTRLSRLSRLFHWHSHTLLISPSSSSSVIDVVSSSSSSTDCADRVRHFAAAAVHWWLQMHK